MRSNDASQDENQKHTANFVMRTIHPKKTRAKGTRQRRDRKQDGVRRKARDSANEGMFERRGRFLVESLMHQPLPRSEIKSHNLDIIVHTSCADEK